MAWYHAPAPLIPKTQRHLPRCRLPIWWNPNVWYEEFFKSIHRQITLGENMSYLTHWGRVTHICVSKLTIIGSDNGLSPERRQAIIWTNAGILLIGPLGTNFSEIWIDIQTFSLKKIRLKMSSAKCCSFRCKCRVYWWLTFVHNDQVKILNSKITSLSDHWKPDLAPTITKWTCQGLLTRYVKLWVAHAPGMSGTFSPPPRVSDPDIHHGTCVTHVRWCMPGSPTSGFVEVGDGEKVPGILGACTTRNFYVFGKRPIKRTGLIFTAQRLCQCQSMTTYSHVIYSREVPCACVSLGVLQTDLMYITEFLAGNLVACAHNCHSKSICWYRYNSLKMYLPANIFLFITST